MTRYAVVSDIHGNIHAFQAVLGAMGSFAVDEVICLGDTVGYGPSPGDCIDLVVKYASYIVQGNHDEAAVDPDCAETFNGAAREAVMWTRGVLGPLHLNALLQTPKRRTFEKDGVSVLCVHDNPFVTATTYVHDKQIAAGAFRGVDVDLCLIGHTHVPMVFEAPNRDAATELSALEITAFIPSSDYPFELDEGRRYICNPGSVGQPRDCDPRASFAIFDSAARTFTIQRIEYDVAAAQASAQCAGLPPILADRLAIGA